MDDFAELVLSEVDNQLIVHWSRGAIPDPCDPDALREHLHKSGYRDWFLFDESLKTLASGCAKEQVGVAVGERRDGFVAVEVAADKMSAWVTLTPPCGGKAVTLENVLAGLEAKGVVFGIDSTALSASLGKNTGERITAATGQPPQHGEHTRFEMLIADSRDRVPTPNAQGLIDFRELGVIPMVETGQALMRRIPPTYGMDGCNVLGEILPAVPGRNESFAGHLVGACVADDDANLLRAVFKGQPVRVGNGVTVEQVVHMKSVGVASGNITFDGTVHVDGDVAPGMKIRATGDIVITGIVDGGDLDAGGNVQVAGGIIAQSNIKAGGSVTARFVEHSSIYAGTIIAIDDMTLQSDLQAINQIMIGIKSGKRGRLVGGSARAMLMIRTPVLGAANSSVTNVMVGVNPVLEAEYQNLLQQIEKQKTEEDKLQKLVGHLNKHGDKAGMLERAEASWQKAVQAWAQLLPQREELEKKLALIENARIEVGVGVSGAVDMVFGKKTNRLRRTYDAGTFLMIDEQIVFVTPDGTHSNVQ